MRFNCYCWWLQVAEKHGQNGEPCELPEVSIVSSCVRRHTVGHTDFDAFADRHIQLLMQRALVNNVTRLS